MKQLAVMKMMTLFCMLFRWYWIPVLTGLALVTNSHIERSAVAGRRGPSGEVTWPVGTEMRGINKLHVGFQAVFHEHLPFICLDGSQINKLRTTAVIFVVLLCKSWFLGLVYQNHFVCLGCSQGIQELKSEQNNCF